MVNSPEGAYFYPPIIADPNPAMGGSIFQGSFSVWRTQNWGGDRDFLEANCPEFTTSFAQLGCGDFVRIGPPDETDLTDTLNFPDPGVYGDDRRFGAVAWIARAPQNIGTIWAATGAGRVFITENANDPAASVVWTRLDSLAANDPNRAISSIHVDPANARHAWISYNGYNVNTPATPGHVFEVTWDGAGVATWTDVSFNLPDFPITAVARDDVLGDLYAASDFGVMKLANGSTQLDGGGHRPSGGRGPRPDDRSECPSALCGDARPQRLEVEPAVTAAKIRFEGRLRAALLFAAAQSIREGPACPTRTRVRTEATIRSQRSPANE